jgi:glucan phosphoethanolaminetransferase (alkaline phosphatase superfamily)
LNSDGLNNAYFNFVATPTNPITTSSTDYYGFQTAFWATVVTAFGLGLIWLAWVHLFPRLAPHTAFVLAILSLIALGVLTLVVPSK